MRVYGGRLIHCTVDVADPQKHSQVPDNTVEYIHLAEDTISLRNTRSME